MRSSSRRRSASMRREYPALARARATRSRIVHRPAGHQFTCSSDFLGPCACCRDNCRHDGCRCALHRNTPVHSDIALSFAPTDHHNTPATSPRPESLSSYASSSGTSFDLEDAPPSAEYYNRYVDSAARDRALRDAHSFGQLSFRDWVEARIQGVDLNDTHPHAQESDSDRESPPHMYASIILQRPQQASSGQNSTPERHRHTNTPSSNVRGHRTHSATMSDDVRHVGGALDAFSAPESPQYRPSFLRLLA